MALQLADLLYLGGFGAEAILDKDNRYIRSKRLTSTHCSNPEQ
jgi:hypothetical protein